MQPYLYMSCIYVIPTAVYVEFVSFPILALMFWANNFQRPAIPSFPYFFPSSYCKNFTHQKHLIQPFPNLYFQQKITHPSKPTKKHHGLFVSPTTFNVFNLLGSGKVSKASAWGPTTIKTNTSSSPPRASKATFHTSQRRQPGGMVPQAPVEVENTAQCVMCIIIIIIMVNFAGWVGFFVWGFFLTRNEVRCWLEVGKPTIGGWDFKKSLFVFLMATFENFATRCVGGTNPLYKPGEPQLCQKGRGYPPGCFWRIYFGV